MRAGQHASTDIASVRTAMQKVQRRIVRPIEMLEEERLAIEREDGHSVKTVRSLRPAAIRRRGRRTYHLTCVTSSFFGHSTSRTEGGSGVEVSPSALVTASGVGPPGLPSSGICSNSFVLIARCAEDLTCEA